MTTKELSFYWQKLKTECPNYWKSEKDEKSGFKAFCQHFELYNKEIFDGTIYYVVRHLIRNGYDWPTTATITNVYNAEWNRRNQETKQESSKYPGFNHPNAHAFTRRIIQLEREVGEKKVPLPNRYLQSKGVRGFGQCIIEMYQREWGSRARKILKEMKEDEPETNKEFAKSLV